MKLGGSCQDRLVAEATYGVSIHAGYVALAKNAGIPNTLINSIDALLKPTGAGPAERASKTGH